MVGVNPLMLVVTNIPTPYRIPLFDELNRQLADEKFIFYIPDVFVNIFAP